MISYINKDKRLYRKTGEEGRLCRKTGGEDKHDKTRRYSSTVEMQTTMRQNKQVQYHTACGQARAILWD